MGMQKDGKNKPMYSAFENETPSRHLTIVFNLFVFMQIFNMICARKINDEINIFNGITTNPAFIIVWTIIVIIQIFCTQFFGRFMAVHVNGLTSYQWLYCLLIALVTYPINLFLKFLPDDWWPILGEEDPQDVLDAERDYELLRAKGEANQVRYSKK
jgi:magnesium-transporting ATPase (P-type)